MQEHQRKVPSFARAEFSKEEVMNFDSRYQVKKFVAGVKLSSLRPPPLHSEALVLAECEQDLGDKLS
jgi:hypothetical protein